MTVFERNQGEGTEKYSFSKQSLEFQMDLIKAKNDRFQRDEKVYKKVADIMGYGFYYENVEDGSCFQVGNWEQVFGFRQDRYENDIDFIKNVTDFEDVQVLRSQQMDSDTLYQELCFSVQGKHWVSNTIFTRKEEGRVAEKISCFRNITNFKRQNEELEYLAYYDMVTGLYNRNYFVKELNDILMAERNEKTYNTISLLCIKINDFKRINEGMGMVVGDEVLQEVGFRLQEFAGENILVGRIEGGEFCIAIYDASGSRSVERIHARIQEKLKEPVRVYQYEPIQIGVSFGVAEYPEAGSSAIELIRNAQIVMKNSINVRYGGLCYYDYRVVNDFMEKLKMERRLKEAANGMGFELYFQPQFDVNTRRLRGAETLLRWRNEDGSFVPNNQYIPIAEQTGEIIRIGKWVLQEAVSLLSKWEKEWNFVGVLSINASALQLRQDDFVPYLIGLIEEYGVSPGNLEIEITESVLMDDMEGIVAKFKILRSYGIRVSLDDFGTGFSSLTYLKDLPIDTLKIDKSFIDSVTTDDSTNIITKSVVKMVKQLGLETVAEGVETEEQYEFLEEIQCDNIQGFLLGRPMPENQFYEVYKNAAKLA